MEEIKRVEPRTLSGFMELLPQDQIKFNEIGWFEFQSTAYAVLNNQEYFLYCSTYTGQIYKVAGKYINQ